MLSETKRIVIIGSYRQNLDGILALVRELTRRGHQVLYPRPGSEKSDENEGFVRLDRDEHEDEGEQQRVVFRLIDQSDLVIAFNPDRRIGTSAALEIGYCLKLGVPVVTTSIPSDITIRKLTSTLELDASEWTKHGAALFDILTNYSNRPAMQAWSSGLVQPMDSNLDIIESIETHTCRVFFSSTHAFKVRKSIDLGFLDYSTPEKRLACAIEESLLGQRISPHVYAGVWYYSARNGQIHQFKTVGSEPVVVMRRLPSELRGDILFKQKKHGQAAVERIDAVAKRMVEFHHSTPADRDERGWGNLDAVGRAWAVNFKQIPHPSESASVPLSAGEWEHLQRETDDWLRKLSPVLLARIREGRVRQTHGDLRIDHVYLTELIVSIIDPLEFDLSLRFTDVAAEIGFLAMTLDNIGRPDVSARLQSQYAIATRDESLEDVLPFFKRYRAIVRMKVEWLRAMQQAPEERAATLSGARRLAELALSYRLP